MGLKLIVAATDEPITLEQAQLHLDVCREDQNELVIEAIRTATAEVESRTNRQLMTATWELSLYDFPGWSREIEIPKPPLQSVTSVTYLDADGVGTVMPTADYVVTDHGATARINPVYNGTWPSTQPQRGAVLIRFVAGYASRLLVPPQAKAAIKLLVADRYENREGMVQSSFGYKDNPAVDRLIAQIESPVMA